MHPKSLVPTVITASFLLLGACQAAENPGVENPSSQAEQNAKVTINIVGENSVTTGNGETSAGSPAETVAEQITESADGTTDEPSDVGIMDGKAVYADFNNQTLEESIGKKPFTLFFYESGDTGSVNLYKNIAKGLPGLPEGTLILKTDMEADQDTALKYTVTAPGTVIVFDSRGNEIYRSVNPPVDELTAAVERSIFVITEP